VNARESLAADRVAEHAFEAIGNREDNPPDILIADALISIAAELRAARVYANYLEGREGARSSGKRDQPTAIFRREP